MDTVSEIILIKGQFYTSDRLLGMGMAACSDCGSIVSVDDKYCHQCEGKTIVLKYSSYKPVIIYTGIKRKILLSRIAKPFRDHGRRVIFQSIHHLKQAS